MELSPEVLRDARFTERFRGYDAGEVDSFLTEAAAALEELLAEGSAPMAELAAERARGAIEEVRRRSLEDVQELQDRRAELEAAIADLRGVLQERRRGVVDELALIDAALEEMPEPAAGGDAETGGSGDDTSGGTEAGDTFLARLEQAAAGGGAPDAS